MSRSVRKRIAASFRYAIYVNALLLGGLWFSEFELGPAIVGRIAAWLLYPAVSLYIWHLPQVVFYTPLSSPFADAPMIPTVRSLWFWLGMFPTLLVWASIIDWIQVARASRADNSAL